jgi:hypothetical protein
MRDEDGHYILNEVAFCNHMETKAKLFDAERIICGVDFAVLTFRYPYQALQSFHKLRSSNQFYNYNIQNNSVHVLVHNKNYEKSLAVLG